MSSEVPIWVPCVNIFLDGFVVVTVPIYIVFMKYLANNEDENIYNSGFISILFLNGLFAFFELINKIPVIVHHYKKGYCSFAIKTQKTHTFLGFCDIPSSIVNLFFNEFPQRGIFIDFFVNDPFWKGRISKAFQFGIQFYQLLSLMILVLNRWFIVKKPVAYVTLFESEHLSKVYLILYFWTILYMAPIYFFSDATIYHENGSYYYGFFESPNIVLIYGISYLGLALTAFLVWIIAYLQISCYITKHGKYEFEQGTRRRRLNKTLIKITAASFFITLGTIIQFVVQISNDIAWRFFGIENLYPILTLLTLTRIGQEMANLSTPWIMIMISPEIRNGMKAYLGLQPSISRVIQIGERQTHANSRSVFPSSAVVASANPI